MKRVDDYFQTIRERLDSANSSPAAWDQLKWKLRQEKQGLMHDLLTGRVRVKPPT